MGGVAEQGDAGGAVPPVADGQRVDRPGDERAVSVGDEGPQALVPAVEVLQDTLLGRFGVGEVNGAGAGGGPVGGRPQGGVDVQRAVGVAVGEEALLLTEREQHASADDGGALGVAGAGVEEVYLDEGDPGVDRGGVRDQGPHPRPGAVGADQHIGGERLPVGERHLVAAVVERPCAGDLGAPADGALGQGAQQEVAQGAPGDLGARAAVAVVLHPDGGVLVEDAHGLAAGVDDRAELLIEPGGPQCGLAGVLVHVQHAALGTGGR